MQDPLKRDSGPELKEFVAEASRALAALDAGRLEELAVSCQALNRELPPPFAVSGSVAEAIAGAAGAVPSAAAGAIRDAAGDRVRAEFRRQAGEALPAMAAFAKVLGVTRANLAVIRQIRESRSRLEYGPGQAVGWAEKGSEHGDN